MLIVERHDRILEILRERKAANLDALAEALNVSTSTVRRDLEMLERKGVVERTHGGAVLKRDAPPAGQGGIALAERIRENVAQKQAIAREVDKLVQPHMTLLMDGGSTVILAARAITARPLQVVTNSLSIANHFADEEQVELILIGGSLYPRTETLVGPIATGCLADLHADLALYSLAGIYGDEAYNINIDMARVEQVMIQQAVENVMLMDSTKFGRKSLTRVCSLGEVDRIITDDRITDEWRQRLADRLLIAPVEP